MGRSAHKIDPKELSAFVDSFMVDAMAKPDDPPGVSFVFVQDGRVVMMRGYGLANVEKKDQSRSGKDDLAHRLDFEGIHRDRR
jgi:CubicO group peptidase (beta-lactamase class C family)